MSAAAPYTTRLAIPAVATYQQLRIAAGLSAKTAEAAAKGLPNSLFAVQELLGDDVVREIMRYIDSEVPPSAYVSLIADGQAQDLYAQFGFRHTAPASVGMALKR